MPKTFRKCSFCPNTTYNNPDIIIFSTSEFGFVCQIHFSDNDIRPHQGSKRFAISFVHEIQVSKLKIEKWGHAS